MIPYMNKTGNNTARKDFEGLIPGSQTGNYSSKKIRVPEPERTKS